MNLVSIALTKFLKIQSSTLQTFLWILSSPWFPSHLTLVLAIEPHNLVLTFVDSFNKCSLAPYYIILPKHWADKQRWIEHRLTSQLSCSFLFSFIIGAVIFSPNTVWNNCCLIYVNIILLSFHTACKFLESEDHALYYFCADKSQNLLRT